MKIYNDAVENVMGKVRTFNSMTGNKQLETVAKTAGAALASGIVAGIACSPIIIPVAVVGGAYAAFSYCTNNYNAVKDHTTNMYNRFASWINGK
jgi:hypothetical protein